MNPMHKNALTAALLALCSCSGGGSSQPAQPIAVSHGHLLGIWLGAIGNQAVARPMNFALEEKPSDPSAFWCRITFPSSEPNPCLLYEVGDMTLAGGRLHFANGMISLDLSIDPNGQALSGEYEVTGGRCMGEAGQAFLAIDQ